LVKGCIFITETEALFLLTAMGAGVYAKERKGSLRTMNDERAGFGNMKYEV